jgi:DNA-binding CsgD family transcriptional regulator
MNLAGGTTDARAFPYWIRESSLVWVRWAVVTALLVLFFLFPMSTRPQAGLIGMGLVAGNIAVCWLARWSASVRSARFARAFSTAMEWLSAVGIVATLGRDLAAVSSVLATALLLPTVVRYRILGLLLASGVGAAILATWIGLHLYVYRLYPEQHVWRLVEQWLVALPLVAVVLALLIWGNHLQRRWDQARLADRRANLKRKYELELAVLREEAAQCATRLTKYKHLDCGLTPRERQVLLLLVDDSLTYKQIGARLFISPGTVKAHVRNIGEALGVSGRWRVVAVARERGLLTETET